MADIAVCDRLLVARARLERTDLLRGSFCPDPLAVADLARCPVDLCGAVNYAYKGDPGIHGDWWGYEALANQIGWEPGKPASDLVAEFSDTHSKTECLALLDAAIEATAPK